MPSVKCNRIPRQRNAERATNTSRRPPPIWGNEDPNLPPLRTAFRDQNFDHSTRNASRLPVSVPRNDGQQSYRRQDQPVMHYPGSRLPTAIRPRDRQPDRTPRPSCRSLNNSRRSLSSNNLQRPRRSTYEVSDPSILIQMQMIERSEASNIFDQSPPVAFENRIPDSPASNGQQCDRRCTYDIPEPIIQQYDRSSNSRNNCHKDGSQSGSFSMTGTIRLYNMNIGDAQQQQQLSPSHSQHRASNTSGGVGLDEYLDNYMDVNMVAPREYAVPGRPYVRIDETRDVATPDSWREMMDNRNSIISQPRSNQNPVYVDDEQIEMCYPSDESIEWPDSHGVDDSCGYAQSSPYEPRSVAPLPSKRTRVASVDREYFPPHRTCRRHTYDRNTN